MKDKRNYLDFIPVRNPRLPWSHDENGIVTVDVMHRGLAAKVAQTMFRKPKVSHIKMDEFGSFIWMQVDGQKNIFEIGQEVKGRFGEKAEPLYERLITFFRTLVDNRYITYRRSK